MSGSCFPSLGNFYPRPPRGGRRKIAAENLWREYISIHALREEGDKPLLGGDAGDVEISIHALREEGDEGRPFPKVQLIGISIHALREEGDSSCPQIRPFP